MKFLLILLALLPMLTAAQEKYSRALVLMGCHFEITVVANSRAEGDRFIDLAAGEVTRIEKLISEWDSTTQVSAVNRQAGIGPVKVDKEVYDLVVRSIRISDLTEGAFDVSWAGMNQIWKFDGSMKRLPTEAEVAAAVSAVGYKNIELNEKEQTIFLRKKGMKIGFGGIGKGYGADKAAALLKSMGVPGGIVNASGDIVAWGKQPDGKPWVIGITNPFNKDKVFSWFEFDGHAIGTSGNYENYVEFNGIRYTHIIDPRTGWPVHGVASVTLFGPNCELSTALTKAIFVMGTDIGLDLIKQLKGIEYIVVDEKGKIYRSDHINLKPVTK
ncbi:MAG: FAD:protein FMN transferase [Marinilabiliales bacterium]|nr:FAD:protein FMN transferase [Marinilabiliales bacterium]